MCAAQALSFRLPDFLRTAAFRSALVGAACFVAATLLLFALIGWQAGQSLMQRRDSLLEQEAAAIAREPASGVGVDIARRYARDLHRITFAALFTRDGRLEAGDMVAPPVLAADGMAHHTTVQRLLEGGETAKIDVRAASLRLRDGRLVVVARGTAELDELHQVISQALQIGLIPGILLALVAGTVASLRAMARVAAINRSIARIMQGDFSGRLPSSGTSDTLDQLAASVNRMLGEIERLMAEVKGVGDNIAHDLRTPLSRLRSRLEGARLRAREPPEFRAVIDRSIEDLDQTLGVITALLRIGELESGRRRAGFGSVSLDALLREAADLYAPLAEERGITMHVSPGPLQDVQADRDLLFEAVVNLLDNAVKFAPAGGWVRLSAEPGPAIRVADSGPGIAANEREAVLKRFYRADPSRHIEGSGLGLSLVVAILRLHGFSLAMRNTDIGFAIDINCSAG